MPQLLCRLFVHYEFSQENNKYFMEFLKRSQEQKGSKVCNLTEYETLNNVFPMDEKLKNDLKSYMAKQNVVIDITDDDNRESTSSAETGLGVEENINRSGYCVDVINQSTIEDLTHSIKEHLETQKYLSNAVLNSLCETQINQEQVFLLLSEELNFEEVINFGISLQTTNIIDDNTICYYIRYLLIKKLTLEYSDQLQNILNQFSIKYSNILLEELVKTLLSPDSRCKLFLQFVDGLNVEFKTKLFRKFIFSCENFHENYINIVEILITAQGEYNTLSKLIEIFSNSVDNFTNDKSFGKLLVKVIQMLGKNVSSLEQPLKHIIGSHKSIWKSKIQKAFDDGLQDSSLLSQSYRY